MASIRTRTRKFWEYEEPDGTMSRVRVKWFVWLVLAMAALGALAAVLGGIGQYWPTILGGACVGAVGTLIAFTVDYIDDRREFNRGKHQD
jgi:membrane-associated phospholipid phosphatase